MSKRSLLQAIETYASSRASSVMASHGNGKSVMDASELSLDDADLPVTPEQL